MINNTDRVFYYVKIIDILGDLKKITLVNGFEKVNFVRLKNHILTKEFF